MLDYILMATVKLVSFLHHPSTHQVSLIFIIPINNILSLMVLFVWIHTIPYQCVISPVLKLFLKKGKDSTAFLGTGMDWIGPCPDLLCYFVLIRATFWRHKQRINTGDKAEEKYLLGIILILFIDLFYHILTGAQPHLPLILMPGPVFDNLFRP